ncbi:TM2 domain-containing protein [Weissella cibaria]|uniref:TM2 domain-containing protein n=4 Tax=Weissella cibaria TaxID=137591 RepID=A0A0D1LKG5_9LACO|nr:TM2 domain-containing protein [Weissella cibaria]KIU20900.1 TM2 domain-containing protein [Weissella cibaria]
MSLISQSTERTPIKVLSDATQQVEPDDQQNGLDLDNTPMVMPIVQQDIKAPVVSEKQLARTPVKLPPIDWTPRSKSKALLLTFFLGYFGVHEFYLGKTNLGIAHLLMGTIGTMFFLGIINFIWVIVEFIGIATAKRGTKWHQDGYGIELED